MSYFYLRSDFFGDGTLSGDAFGSLFQDNQYLVVSSENFNNSAFIRNISTRYLESINIVNNSSILYQEPIGLANNGAALMFLIYIYFLLIKLAS